MIDLSGVGSLRLDEVLDACALRQDLAIFAHGDMTGECGALYFVFDPSKST